MGLICKLFTEPPDVQLEACLVQDSAHVTPGSRGEHVRKIQMALNRLSKGPGRENFKLKEDGIYGPRTAAAVKKYKAGPHGEDSKPILQPWQKTPDDIVGKRTIQSLDEEMAILEEESEGTDYLVSTKHEGDLRRHDHTKCPLAANLPGGSEYWATDKRISHMATPVNPQRFGEMISLGGQGEAHYLGFQDCVPDPTKDPDFPAAAVQNRRITTSLKDGSVSDICVRSAPIDKWMKEVELPRICAPGCRLTYAGESVGTWTYLATLGPIIYHGVFSDGHPTNRKDRTVIVVQIWRPFPRPRTK